MKAIVGLAVVFGMVVVVVIVVIQNNKSLDGLPSTSGYSSDDALDPKNLPVEVLKALPPEELAEIFPEKAEAILNPESAGQIKTGGKSSDDPEYLRAVIQKLGGTAPDDATTKELQDILATLSTDQIPSGK